MPINTTNTYHAKLDDSALKLRADRPTQPQKSANIASLFESHSPTCTKVLTGFYTSDPTEITNCFSGVCNGDEIPLSIACNASL